MNHTRHYILPTLLSLLITAIIIGCGGESVEKTVQKQSDSTVAQVKKEPAKKITDKEKRHKHVHNIMPDSLAAGNDSTLNDTITVNPDSTVLRILSIGNSYSRDAFSYVPLILNELLPGLEVNMTIMYFPGRPLKDHWTALQNSTREYQRDTYTTKRGTWRTEKGHSLPEELDSLRQWDLIFFQQGSIASPSYETYQPFLHNLITAARQRVPHAGIGWLMTPAHPDGASSMPTATSHDMWELICDATEQVMSDERIDLMLPGGTAVQNARQTYLDSLGSFGHLSADGRHLQDGIPCLIEAYTIAQKLLNHFHLHSTIALSTLRPTQQWVREHNIPEVNGEVIEGTRDDYSLVRRIALRAIYNPYSLFSSPENP